MESNPKSPIAEAYRTLRTNIDFSSVDEAVQIIMLTSTQPGEGKSTTTANLALAYVQAGKRVLLIDADLRKPTIHKIFNRTNRVGLTSLLAGNRQIQELPMDSYIDNLDILTSGPIPPNPSELLASKKMKALLEELRNMYDMIIIDTPPAIAVTDANLLASHCDGVVLVIDSGKVKREQALRAKLGLEHAKARLLGVVLNNKDRKEADDYYYYTYYGND
ncbi:CpsD/CapB family tyrosine-protein kinase [Gorillibacterium sp. sgz5001074]|uniref:CpsD/CapB family tyrosine-protein kinase n=1 Tax=Gorillibacterium sp. sgz5001074 TaxID=3446695 RepID=UPI003F66C737